TPINGIMGMTAIALSTDLDQEQTEYLELIMTSADSLCRIVNDILDFSKIEARKLEIESLPFALSECVEQLMKSVSVQARAKNLQIRAAVASEVPDNLVGDPGRLRQVLLNLLNNAIKFTNEGAVSLTVGLEARSAQAAVLRFAVTDTGMGIPKEKQRVIFDAFSQADNSLTRKFGGTGLGLTISSQLVQLMHGAIWVDSEPDRGSTFYFTSRFALPPVVLESMPLAS